MLVGADGLLVLMLSVLNAVSPDPSSTLSVSVFEVPTGR